MKPLLSMLLLLLQLPAEAALEARWWSLSAGTEGTWHQDQNPIMFRDAQGRTASLYGGAGAGNRWTLLGGFSRQDLWQDWWSYRGLTRMAVAKVAVGSHWGVELLGHSTTAFQETWYGADAQAPDSAVHSEASNWGAGAGLNWCPNPFNEDIETIGLRVLRAPVMAANSKASRHPAMEVALARKGARGDWYVEEKVGLLGNRKQAKTKVAALVAIAARRGSLGLQGRAMVGRQAHWFEAERLVVHDGASDLRSAASLGLSWQLWKGLSVEGSVGQDRTEDSRSRWAFASLRWTQLHWATLE